MNPLRFELAAYRDRLFVLALRGDVKARELMQVIDRALALMWGS
jgi:hypothetical protein